MAEDWQPSASHAALHKRAELYAAIREFFQARNVLEVETPSISRHSVTDPYIASFAVSGDGWLQTSPEFAMKRLLAAGSGSIFQICKAFRIGETGSGHNSEFSLLEWYRLEFDEFELMEEVEQLLSSFLPCSVTQHYSYAGLFQKRFGIDPHSAGYAELFRLVGQHFDSAPECVDEHQCLDLLFSHVLQPDLHELTFVYDYPASQAALACLGDDVNGTTVARRFECFYRGVELANGYFELTDDKEYLRRCETDSARRDAYGLPAMQIDSRFVAAMQQGLPVCAGVALGLDRLLMLMLNVSSISAVLSFTADRA